MANVRIRMSVSARRAANLLMTPTSPFQILDNPQSQLPPYALRRFVCKLIPYLAQTFGSTPVASRIRIGV